MKRFTELFMELDASNRTTAKLAALKRYFNEVPPADAAWAVYFLTGQRIKRVVKTGNLRDWAAGACGFPLWMLEECYNHVGDLAETLALLMNNRGKDGSESTAPPLHELVETRILALRGLETEDQRQKMVATWAELSGDACFVFNKLITGGFRVGVSRTLVNRALAEVVGVEPAIMAHRLMGDWRPTPENYRALFDSESARDDPARPYPFCLAYPLDDKEPETLGPVSDWQVEWKWDGIRAQLIKRGGEVLLWSRGEELVGDQFPEVIEAAQAWPDEVVLDGELLAWAGDGPAPFSELQRRLGRKKVGPKLRREVPVVFMAYDLMERQGEDYREKSTVCRRKALERYTEKVADDILQRSALVEVESWSAAAALREESRQRRVEGLMLKHKEVGYFAGRKKGEWWKWKVDPYTVDAVLVYAQQGHGRRAGLYTDYTFSIWRGGELVPFAKAYSGLSDKEIREVDRWIRQNTLDSHGPVRVVEPELVFEIAFEGISPSKRHKSGIAVRFPRIHRWRRDKPKTEADTLETVLELL
ncbi:ATP-dependent DNA ligase [Coraliomargarita sinensis]|uniref:DNA ligase (ATP) n=1 Tax=Coraliomargarita sinensis TaxID=2174842 RepID=A0A317ZJM7_9BACT|nr:ATP-dependent DNA ligase [Coraliomargarita sinensis]PXA03561.1 ATP-dependent DNA ligase [Coraliomargarita sinensis]